MKHGWQWQQREYDIEPGEVLRMKSGTTLEVLKIHGSVALARLVKKGKTDHSQRKNREVSLYPCYMLERMEKVA